MKRSEKVIALITNILYKNMNSGNNSTLYKTYKQFSHKLNSILLIQQTSQKIHYSNIKNQSK